ncbi:MAG: tail fiber domain-containing protein [Symploca sp. SIO2D2]|nr:tail fiber domain-containing protein [Symploca sp. SIO2D2]
MTNKVEPHNFSSVIDLVSDVAATISLTTLVSDAAGATVLHVDGSTSNQLVITITNQTSGEVDVTKLTWPPTSSNSNIIFSFPNNQFYFYTAPTIDATVSTPGIWELATDAESEGGWVEKIYLANTGICTLGAKGAADDTLKLVINYGGAVPDDPTTVNVPVQVQYQNIQTASGIPIQGSTPPQTLILMANAGIPLPLVGEFVGPRTVLNDGTTPRDLTLRLVNTSLDPIQFIVPPRGQPTQSYIEVAFPVSDSPDDTIWALWDTAAWESFKGNASLSGSAATGWNVTRSNTTPGVFELRPDFTKVKNIPPASTLDLVLTGVKSSLEPGYVQVQVSLKRFALYGTQTFGVALEKTPLVYNRGLGSGMTLSAGSLGANKALAILGDSSSSVLSVEQSGTGPAVSISGGSLGINTSTPSQPLDVNGNANISGTLSANSISATTNGATIDGGLTVANGATIYGGLKADKATVYGLLLANSISATTGGLTAGSATIYGPLLANSISATTGGLTANGFVNLCPAPDYSLGTVGIGGTTYNNYMLMVTNNQTIGTGIGINAPHTLWALSVKGLCINTTGSWYQFSDMNLKENVQPFSDGLAQVLKIDPIRYHFKEETGLGANREQVGVSAQALENVAPYMVGKTHLEPDSDEEYLCIDSGHFTYMLINAVKELHAEIETMKAEIEALKKH